MDPKINNISVDNDMYKFTLSGVNVSIANALRRTILTDIPINVIYTETYQDNQCHIDVNTTRLHNEIIKHRLSCIPIHLQELDILPNNYVLECDVQNETDTMMMVTTEDFKIKNKTNGNYLTKEEMKKIFPPSSKTNMYIDFARLNAGTDTVPGEHIKLSAEFSVHTAKENSMFNVVSTCSYGNTIDLSRVDEMWKEQEKILSSEQVSKTDIEMQKRNFYLLDAQRYYTEDSFDFCIETLGIYENTKLVKMGCAILVEKMENMVKSIDSDLIPIRLSEVTMDNSFDIVLEEEDYTVGKLLEFILYNNYYENEKIFSFCGFKKFHPHDDESIIRIAYKKPSDKNMVRMHLNAACVVAKEIFQKIGKMF